MELAGMDLGGLYEQLATWQNIAIMVACGVLMEGVKKVLPKFAASDWGMRLARVGPLAWAWLMLLLPWNLAPAGATFGEKIVLGVLLGSLTGHVYGTFKGLLKQRTGSGLLMK
jgi:hypothetical protein